MTKEELEKEEEEEVLLEEEEEEEENISILFLQYLYRFFLHF